MTPEERKQYNKEYKLKNQAKIKADRARYYQENKESTSNYNKLYNLEHKQVESPSQKEWRKVNKDRIYSSIRKYKKANPGKINASHANRRAAKLQATPKWITKEQVLEIQKIYENCPEGCEVDHIIPLLGDTVRGLHVPWNLQYLTKSENRKKSNKINTSE